MPAALTLEQRTLALADRRRVSRLLEESNEMLAYHDQRRIGLQASNDVYRQHLAVLDAKLTPTTPTLPT